MLGLLLPDRSHSEVIKAARLAIDQANREGGYKGVPFGLSVRTAEGFWGAGSKESVNLVYEDRVRAIIGSLDGRNGHLAEQVATKSHLAYIECMATEPTLSQAFVPWFTRVVPNDNQQARALLGEILKRGGGKTAILTSGNYDTRYAVRSLTTALASEGMPPVQLSVETDPSGLSDLISSLGNTGVQHLVMPFGSPLVDQLAGRIHETLPDLQLYGTLHFHMDLEKRLVPMEGYEGTCMVGSPHPWNREGQLLMTEWYERYGELPDLRQVYVFDAVKRLIAAIRLEGLNREAISKSVLEDAYEGASTGPIQYDELGNRLSAVTLVQVENGQLRLLR